MDFRVKFVFVTHEKSFYRVLLIAVVCCHRYSHNMEFTFRVIILSSHRTYKGWRLTNSKVPTSLYLPTLLKRLLFVFVLIISPGGNESRINQYWWATSPFIINEIREAVIGDPFSKNGSHLLPKKNHINSVLRSTNSYERYSWFYLYFSV